MGRVRERLSRLAGRPRKVHLTRGYPGHPTDNGFVVGIGRSLVLVQTFHDFYPEGYSALRIEDIKRVRSGKHERFLERVFRGEGLMEHVGISYDVPLDDFRSLLGGLHERGQHVVIECEDRENAAHNDYFIGRILSVDDESVTALYFNPLGVWDDEPSIISLGDITQVEFDTPYINIMSKYLKDPPSTNGRA
jgi:hypothetical protein